MQPHRKILFPKSSIELRYRGGSRLSVSPLRWRSTPRRGNGLSANTPTSSMPSAHVAHIASIATAVSMQMHSIPVTAIGSALVALVSWDRFYEDQHWTSDVTTTIALSTAVASATVRWLESRRQRH